MSFTDLKGINDFGDIEERDTFIAGGSAYASASFGFDAFGRETSRTDALGSTVFTRYDALGNLVSQSGATYPVRYGYDTLGRMKELGTTRDGTVWDTTRWLYDFATGLVTNKVYADGSTVAYSYTPNGKPLRTTWARGEWRENSYNSDGLPAATTYSDATPTVTLAYDAFQRLAAASNAVTAYAYANSNLNIATNETVAMNSEVCTLTRGLDDRQRLASLNVGGSQAHYAYDAENRLAAVSNAAFVTEYAYTPDGYDAGYAVTLTNGIVLARSLVRDPYRRSLVRAITNSVEDVTISTYQYGHDELNRAISRNTDTFGYNARSEVIAAHVSSNEYGYAYDNIGNHTASTINAVETTYSANALNQYTSILCAPAPLREPTYDSDGNLLTDGLFAYIWDAENRLTAVYSNSTCIVSNAYDHQSRRVLKVTPTATHTFVYDGWNLVRETVQKAQSTVTNRFVWGRDLSGTLQGAGGIGGLLAVQLDCNWYFPFYDNNGNITAYVDESGSVVAEYTYDAFGLTISQTGPMADAFPHRFSTKYIDPETGLYYYGYRFYAPELMRWLNRDLIEEKGGLNLYEFLVNNSLLFIDYLGMKGVVVCSPNYDGNTVNVLSDIVETPKASGGGQFRVSGVKIKRTMSGAICRISIATEIIYNSSLPKTIEPGKAVGYNKHITWDNRGLLINPDQGAVLAHERGHAKGFLTQVAALKRRLNPFIGRRFVTHDTIQLTFSSFISSPTFESAVAEGANKATLEYFSNSEFKPIVPAKIAGIYGELDYAWR